ncbi:MAG: hypothetical protein AB8I08_27260 [Sandaracinaceae bacterium]
MFRRRYTLALWCALSLVACDGGDGDDAGIDASAMDAGTTDSGTADAGRDAGRDSGADAGGDGDCIQATVGAWEIDFEEDVSIKYQAPISMMIDGRPYELVLRFFRYGGEEYTGSFDLSMSPDADFGGCPRCVMATSGDSLEGGFFVEAGTLVSNEDPFARRLDVTLTGLRLVESEFGSTPEGVLTSTPIEGGACIEFAPITVSQVFPRDGWSCPTEQYDDGLTCHCNCGAFDPDCGTRCPFPPEPGCDDTPLPMTGCGLGEICTLDGGCATGCDFFGRTACTTGVCAFGLEGDQCFDSPDARIDGAGLGEICEGGNFYCGVDSENFAMGLCDDLDANRCKPVCEDDGDCPIDGEFCYTVFSTDQGYCRPPPPDDG